MAAKHGDPLSTANAIQPREAYAKLIAHYREPFEAYGHDPAEARGPAGSGGLLIADSSQAAVAQYKELYKARVLADVQAASGGEGRLQHPVPDHRGRDRGRPAAHRLPAADHRQDPRLAHRLPPRPPVGHRGRLRAEPTRAAGDAPGVRGGDRPGGAAGDALDALAVKGR
ncbi:LLM class flavin-dependent oxidoreductase [Streptomyces sp. HNA39]|nr:LLM class flavin-dependent oxidoreductase [Streptomyces sp. HNA39]